MEGARHGGVNGGEQGNSGMCVCLVLLASCAAFNIFTDIGGEAGPPEFSHNKLTGFQVAGMPSGFVIMATLEDEVAKGFIIGNIDMTLIGQDAHFNLPVRKARVEGKGNILVHGL